MGRSGRRSGRPSVTAGPPGGGEANLPSLAARPVKDKSVTEQRSPRTAGRATQHPQLLPQHQGSPRPCCRHRRPGGPADGSADGRSTRARRASTDGTKRLLTARIRVSLPHRLRPRIKFDIAVSPPRPSDLDLDRYDNLVVVGAQTRNTVRAHYLDRGVLHLALCTEDSTPRSAGRRLSIPRLSFSAAPEGARSYRQT